MSVAEIRDFRAMLNSQLNKYTRGLFPERQMSEGLFQRRRQPATGVSYKLDNLHLPLEVPKAELHRSFLSSTGDNAPCRANAQ